MPRLLDILNPPAQSHTASAVEGEAEAQPVIVPEEPTKPKTFFKAHQLKAVQNAIQSTLDSSVPVGLEVAPADEKPSDFAKRMLLLAPNLLNHKAERKRYVEAARHEMAEIMQLCAKQVPTSTLARISDLFTSILAALDETQVLPERMQVIRPNVTGAELKHFLLGQWCAIDLYRVGAVRQAAFRVSSAYRMKFEIKKLNSRQFYVRRIM